MTVNPIIEGILSKYKLKKTPVRIEMLDLFMNNNFALSASDIEGRLKANHDRVTVYRTLNAFEENGILHKVPDDGYGIKYAMCSDSCPDSAHDDQHVHFICHECRHTFCLDHVHIPMIKLPDGYAVDGFTYTVNGVCKDCKRNR